ncbi:MAG: hypothetical protein ABI543_06070 [Ignavibacteria bacterium]
MKKAFLIFFLLISVKFIYSDQLAWISKEQAEKTVKYFEDNEITQVIMWCACCDNDYKLVVDISKIYYKPASDPQYYEIYIEGTKITGGGIKGPVDLAYIHIKRGSKWRCLGKELKFECDPCTKAFKY